MPRTKKVGIAGKYGARYGSTIRKRVINASKGGRKSTCPKCIKLSVTREAAGIWSCSRCGYKFAGKSYKPR